MTCYKQEGLGLTLRRDVLAAADKVGPEAGWREEEATEVGHSLNFVILMSGITDEHMATCNLSPQTRAFTLRASR